MVAGDSCFLRAGTYSYGTSSAVRPANSGTSSQPITYQNYNGEAVTISLTAQAGTSNYAFDLSGRNYHVINGFTMTGGEACVLMYAGSNYNQILNNTCTGGQRGGIMVVGSANNNTVRGNTVHDAVIENWPRGTKNASKGEFWGNCLTILFGASNNLIENNLVYWCHGEGISTGIGSGNVIRGNIVSDAWSVNIYVDGAPNTIVENNFSYVSTDAKNWTPLSGANLEQATGIGISTEPLSGNTINGLIIRNNISVNANGCIYHFPSQPGITDNNIQIYNNTCVQNNGGIKWVTGAVTNISIRNNIITGPLANNGDATIQMNPAPSGGTNTISNNSYSATPANFCWVNCTASFASWVASSGDTFSTTTNPGLVNAAIIPPRLWSDPSLPAPSPVQPLATMVAPYMPASGSAPTINTGATLSGFAYDILGTTRPQGAAWDIGAAELSF